MEKKLKPSDALWTTPATAPYAALRSFGIGESKGRKRKPYSSGGGGNTRTGDEIYSQHEIDKRRNQGSSAVDSSRYEFIPVEGQPGNFLRVARSSSSEEVAAPAAGMNINVDYGGYGSSAIDALLANMGWQEEIANRQLAISERYLEIANEQYGFWQTNYKPIEERLAGEAKVGLDPEYYAARARATVGTEYDQARQVQGRNLARLGVDATSPRYVGLERDVQIAKAAAMAGAGTSARDRVRDVNWNRRYQVAQLGRQSVGSGLSALGGASSAASASGAAYNTGATNLASGYTTQQQLGINAQQFAANYALQQAAQQIGQNQFNASLAQDQQQFMMNYELQQQQLQNQENSMWAQLFGGVVGTAGPLFLFGGLGGNKTTPGLNPWDFGY